MCEWSNPSCLTIRIQGNSLGLLQDLYIIMVYIPPENNSYLKSTGTNPFDLLLQAHNRIHPMAHVIWMGDFNAHLDQENSSSPHVTPELLPALNFDLASADPPLGNPWITAKSIHMVGSSSSYVVIEVLPFSMDVPQGILRDISLMKKAPSVVL